ncbi:MAG: type II secretion system protein [Henriciella sp.]|uniref:PulJ/GspJ family protein n=1 Tax=Henriciella sp. TaxID=1968823 RepID=UPI003C77CC12
MTQRRSDAGFTLMETLVAFAIFSLSVVAILQSYSLSSRSQVRAQASQQTAEFLGQLMSTVEARLDAPGETSGTTPDGYEWSLRVEEPEDGLCQITGVVTDTFGRRQTATTLRWKVEIFPRSEG